MGDTRVIASTVSALPSSAAARFGSHVAAVYKDGDDWREMRLRTPQGMVTVRRDGERLSFVTWGNADAAMLQAWNAIVWAFAEAGGGMIETPDGELDAAAYRGRADLPAGLRT